MISFRASLQRDFVQTDILDGGPDNGETTGLRCEHINLIGALPHIAEQAFDGVGGLNMSVQGLRKLVKREEVLFIFRQAAQRYPEAVRSSTEDEEHLLTFYTFPAAMYRHIQTTNAIESLFSNVRQRTHQIDVFTTEMSCLTIVWATIQDIRLHKISME